jgi:hypothetical protein
LRRQKKEAYAIIELIFGLLLAWFGAKQLMRDAEDRVASMTALLALVTAAYFLMSAGEDLDKVGDTASSISKTLSTPPIPNNGAPGERLKTFVTSRSVTLAGALIFCGLGLGLTGQERLERSNHANVGLIRDNELRLVWSEDVALASDFIVAMDVCRRRPQDGTRWRLPTFAEFLTLNDVFMQSGGLPRSFEDRRDFWTASEGRCVRFELIPEVACGRSSIGADFRSRSDQHAVVCVRDFYNEF